MDAQEFIDKFNGMAREYTTMQGIEVVDKDGNPIDTIFFNHKENKIIIMSKNAGGEQLEENI